MSSLAQEAAGRMTNRVRDFGPVLRDLFESPLTKGLLWTVLGAACARGGVVVVSFALARFFDRNVFGELGVIDATLAMLAVFGNLGLSLTATKFVAKYHVTDPHKAGRILVLCLSTAVMTGILIALLVLAFAERLANDLLAAPHLVTQLRWLVGVIPLTVLNGTFIGCLTGFRAFKALAKINVLIPLFSVPITIFAGYGWGIRGVIGAYLIVQSMLCWLYLIEVFRKAGDYRINLSIRGIWAERGVFSSISLPALINASLSAPVNWLCVMILVNTGNGYQEMGILNVVNVWFLMMLFLPGQLSQVYYPMLEDQLARGNSVAARALVGKAVAMNLLACSAAAIGITLFADQILALYGAQYLAAKRVLVITVWAACLSGIQQPFAVYLVACSRMWLVTCCALAWAVVTFTLSVLLVDGGALGISTARLAGYAFYALLSASLGLRLFRQHARVSVDTQCCLDVNTVDSPRAEHNAAEAA